MDQYLVLLEEAVSSDGAPDRFARIEKVINSSMLAYCKKGMSYTLSSVL